MSQETRQRIEDYLDDGWKVDLLERLVDAFKAADTHAVEMGIIEHKNARTLFYEIAGALKAYDIINSYFGELQL